MFTIALIRPYGHNVGNAAISFAMKNMLHDVFGRLVSVVEYPATSKYDSKKAGLSATVVHEINRYADGVIIGGGNLYENNEIDIDPIALAHLQVPLMLFANSRGRIYDRYGRLAERTDVIPDSKLHALVSRADISLSRDSSTHDYIVKMGLANKDVVGWCPTINIGKYVSNLPRLPASEEAGVLISVRTPSLMNLPYRLQNKVTKDLEDTIDMLRDLGHKRVRLLCNDSRDLDYSNSFRLSKKIDTVFTNDVYVYLSLLKNSSLVVSFRLHASLPAVSMGVPAVNISYDERAISLFENLDLSDQHLNYVELEQRFRDELELRLSSASRITDSYELIHASWSEKSKNQFTALRSFKDLVSRYLQTSRLV